MRGAATDGEYWIFFAHRAGENESNYARSRIFHIGADCATLDLILGLLMDWVSLRLGIPSTFRHSSG